MSLYQEVVFSRPAPVNSKRDNGQVHCLGETIAHWSITQTNRNGQVSAGASNNLLSLVTHQFKLTTSVTLLVSHYSHKMLFHSGLQKW